MVDRSWSSFYFHHTWSNWEKAALSPFPYAKDHVLLKQATELKKVDEAFKNILTDEIINNLVNLIPNEWLNWNNEDETIDDIRNVYKEFLKIRRDNSNLFIKEAENARKALI